MGFRDDSEAARARAEALDRENRDLRRQMEALQKTASSERTEAARPRRSSPFVVSGILVLVTVGALAATRSLPPVLIAIVVMAGVLLGMMLFTLGLAVRLICIASPDEALVIAGRAHRLPDGRQVGYRIVIGGRALRLPVIEQVHRMSLRPFRVSIELDRAYANGGEPVSLQVAAVVKVSRDPERLANAVDRFLGRTEQELAEVARQTIEGNLRTTVARLTVEKIEDDRLLLDQTLMSEAEGDMDRLGLVLESLQVKQVVREARAEEALSARSDLN